MVHEKLGIVYIFLLPPFSGDVHHTNKRRKNIYTKEKVENKTKENAKYTYSKQCRKDIHGIWKSAEHI